MTALLRFFCALARQCFVNEYVFFCGADEASDARRLRDSLAQALASRRACFPAAGQSRSRRTFRSTRFLRPQELEARAWPDCVNELLTQQIREPREERLLRASIPRLTAIEDDVSLKVREMYEENPYPRWIKVAPTESPKPLDVYLARPLPGRGRVAILPAKASLDILIAGCGTGPASRRNGAALRRREGAGDRLVAWRASPMRNERREKLGLGNIEYGQADILTFGQLGRSFDLIEFERRAAPSRRSVGGMARAAFAIEARRASCASASTASWVGLALSPGRALVAERGYRADAEGHPTVPAGADHRQPSDRRSRT